MGKNSHDAFKILALVENKAMSDGHAPDTVSAIVKLAKQDLTESIGKGIVPELKSQNPVLDRFDDDRGR